MIFQIQIQIENEELKRDLLKLKTFFIKTQFTNRKAKDCLEALRFIERGEIFDSNLGVRLLGQIPESNPVYKKLYFELALKFKSNGLDLIDKNGALHIVPDDPYFRDIFNQLISGKIKPTKL